MFGLSTQAHKKHIQAVKRQLKNNSGSSSILTSCNRTVELFFGGMSIEEIEIHDSKYWASVIIDFIKSYPLDFKSLIVYNLGLEPTNLQHLQTLNQEHPFIFKTFEIKISWSNKGSKSFLHASYW